MARQFQAFHPSLRRGVFGAASAALAFAVFLTVRSVMHFTTTGPTIQEEIAANFATYAILAVARLTGWAFGIALLMALAGMLVYAALVAKWRSPGWIEGFLAGGFGICVGFFFQFSYVLVHEPSTILASWAYAPWRLVSLWPYVHYPTALEVVKLALFLAVVLAIASLVWRFGRAGRMGSVLALLVPSGLVFGGIAWAHWDPEPHAAPVPQTAGSLERPNIIMIGNDSMRADRVGAVNDYHRDLTPFIDQLIERGTYFSEAYVPQGRTAPSMASILTGTWPATHGVISNFSRDDQTDLGQLPTLPKQLREQGYKTAAVGDWASSDIGKLDFGFEDLNVAPDQWNFKYLLRQGPRDLRLFVSLFTGNSLGQRFIPEIYYLAGRPLTSEKSRQARRKLSELAAQPDPFLMMMFVATSHGPFGSEYPYYIKYSGKEYSGSAKFSMVRVSTPEEIAERQAEGREAFDVDQLIDLYDATVRHFDDEVKKIVEHIERLGIAEHTIIVIFSDHGTDFFERGTWGQGNIVGVQDYSTHIPLLFVDPRKSGGHVVPDLVRAVDVAPTLLELTGAPPHEGFEGVSLAPYLEGSGLDRKLAAYVETGELISTIAGMREDQIRVPPILDLLVIPDRKTGTIAITEEGAEKIEAARQRAIRTNGWMTIMVPLKSGQEYMLFNAREDSEGLNEVSEEHPEVIECFRPAFMNRDRLAQGLEELSACLANENRSVLDGE